MESGEAASSIRLSLGLATSIVRPLGNGIMVGKIRALGSGFRGRGGIVHFGVTVAVLLIRVFVHRLKVRVIIFDVVMVLGFGVTVIVLVLAGMVTVLVFGTVVLSVIVEVALKSQWYSESWI